MVLSNARIYAGTRESIFYEQMTQVASTGPITAD
jgi:hypothetical protein